MQHERAVFHMKIMKTVRTSEQVHIVSTYLNMVMNLVQIPGQKPSNFATLLDVSPMCQQLAWSHFFVAVALPRGSTKTR